MQALEVLQSLGMDTSELEGLYHAEDTSSLRGVWSPIDGSLLARLQDDQPAQVMDKVALSQESFKQWRQVPGPVRGELVRQYSNKLREYKSALATMISLECGKIYSEALGEVQEMIDICDFAVGLSRQLYGLTIASERPAHVLREHWHPLGPVGVISAFNFPMAVWAWNASLAWVCGDTVIWKPSEKTPLCAIACQHLFEQVATDFDAAPKGLSTLVLGDGAVGHSLVTDKRIPLISATGSCAMGRRVAPLVAERFGRCLLELGGNNAVIVAPSADLELAIRGIVFGAVGTAGQRCTTTRRVFVHESLYDDLKQRILKAYQQIEVGDPLKNGVHVGPLIDKSSYDSMQSALASALEAGCQVSGGQRLLKGDAPDAYFVAPALVEGTEAFDNNATETFAPILYFFKYNDLSDAIERQNAVPQGLSSAIFTTDMRESELFLSTVGSDCGITNVNLGTSGAEIGGAFGGEKDTGGGRESGSDAWKSYMRRATATINYSNDLPLAQGISFSIDE